MFTRQNVILFLGTLIGLCVLFFIFVHPTTPPWKASGRLILAVRSVPGPETDLTMFLGIDNIELLTPDGTTKTVTVLNRRLTLDPSSSDIELVLDIEVPVGNYSGIAFILTSPELRNPWQGEEAPQYISLESDTIRLETPYHIDENVTSAILLSFETLQAIHEENGAQLYLPVIQIETRSHTTLVPEENERIQLQGGEIQNSATFGMDWDGRMRYNFRAQPRETPPLEEVPIPTPQQEEVIVPNEFEIDTASSTATSTPESRKDGEEMEEEQL